MIVFFWNNSIPLIETLFKGIICNEFSDNSLNEKIYSIYNFSSKKITGSFINIEIVNLYKFIKNQVVL